MPHHSTIAAYAALVVAIGGGATATAAGLSRNSVGTTQIRDRSVHVRDLARTARPPSRARIASVVTDTMTSQDVLSALSGAVKGTKGDKGDAGTPGAPGAQGPSGVAGAVVRDVSSDVVQPGQEGGTTARCQPGERVLGGGGRFEATGQSGAVMTSSLPLTDSEQGWSVTMAVGAGSQPGRVHVYAICAQA